MNFPHLQKAPCNNEFEENNSALKVECNPSKAISRTTKDCELLAMLGHDLRSPLNGILGFLELLRGTNLDADQRRYLEIAIDCAAGLYETLEGLLDYAEIDSGRFLVQEEAADLIALLQHSAEIFRLRAMRHGLEFHLKIPQDMPTWWTFDRVKFRRILSNLLDNAIKFTKEGFIHMGVEKISREADGRTGIRLTVQDSGIGIPEDQLEHIFDAYYQANNSGSKKQAGWGLGLAIVRKLVSALNGQLEIRSRIDCGTIITLVFYWTEFFCPPETSPEVDCKQLP